MPLKQINHITGMTQRQIGGSEYTQIQTANPSTPTKFSTCASYILHMMTRTRVAQQVPHGKKVWVPDVNPGLAPTICSADSALWISADPCPPGSPCDFFIAEPQEVPPAVNWNSMMHSCAGEEPPDAIAIATDVVWGLPGGAPWESVPFVGTAQPPLAPDGIDSVALPSTGSYSASGGSQWAIDPGGPTPSYAIHETSSGLAIAIAQPYAPDARACSGSLAQSPRLPITRPGMRVAQGFSTSPGAGNCFMVAKNVFIVSWWNA